MISLLLPTLNPVRFEQMKVWHLMQLAPADKGPKSTLSTIASIFHEQCLCQLSSRDY